MLGNINGLSGSVRMEDKCRPFTSILLLFAVTFGILAAQWCLLGRNLEFITHVLGLLWSSLLHRGASGAGQLPWQVCSESTSGLEFHSWPRWGSLRGFREVLLQGGMSHRILSVHSGIRTWPITDQSASKLKGSPASALCSLPATE